MKALTPEQCPTGNLRPNEAVHIRTRIGTGHTPDQGINRSLNFNIGPQTGQEDTTQICQFKLQALRVRANMGSINTIKQDEPCLGCGRRITSESQLIP